MDDGLGRPRWDGTPGRIEVWYATLTDPATGHGFWIHYETVAPHPDGEPYGHGWAAVFPADGAPHYGRFGPAPAAASVADDDGSWFSSGGSGIGPGRLHGVAGDVSWDLSMASDAAALWTFSRRAWERELLPGAQMLPAPAASFSGFVQAGGRRFELAGASGGLARIYGHGNAERWGWLHADLGGGDVLEVVTAVSRRPGLRLLPPMAAVQLRVDGVDWPADPLKALPMFRTGLGLPDWSVRGVVGRRRLRVEVAMPAERCVALAYTDPDGATATCTNTERADVRVAVDRWDERWVEDRRWVLDGTGHAEVGDRP